ncbi:hypothetical protein EDD16DRAFT_1541064 [Pisolithus croceorrhizus]|nr:hypothetical protein EDD16DRAFT_1541064 [Pisolithus croceorrhizus]
MRLSLLVPSCYLLGCSTKAIHACARKPCVMPHSKSGTRHETVELILVRKKSYICTVATIQSQRSVRCTRTTSKSSVECVVRKKLFSPRSQASWMTSSASRYLCNHWPITISHDKDCRAAQAAGRWTSCELSTSYLDI